MDKRVKTISKFLENRDYEGICGFSIDTDEDPSKSIIVVLIIDMDWITKVMTKPGFVAKRLREFVQDEIQKYLGIKVHMSSIVKKCSELKENMERPINYLISESQLKIIVEKLRDSNEFPLYHHTSEERAMRIIDENRMKGSVPDEEYLNIDKRLAKTKHKSAISLTRDKNFEPGLSIGVSTETPTNLNVIFVLDRNKLKQQYKIEPFNYSSLFPEIEADMGYEKNPELEERVLTKQIYPLRPYVIDIIYKGSNPEVQDKIDNYLNRI